MGPGATSPSPATLLAYFPQSESVPRCVPEPAPGSSASLAPSSVPQLPLRPFSTTLAAPSCVAQNWEWTLRSVASSASASSH